MLIDLKAEVAAGQSWKIRKIDKATQRPVTQAVEVVFVDNLETTKPGVFAETALIQVGETTELITTTALKVVGVRIR